MIWYGPSNFAASFLFLLRKSWTRTRKIHLSRKIQYLEFFSMFCMVVELYIEFVVGRSSLHRKKFNQIRLVVLVLWNNFPCCPKRSSLLGFDILLSMYFWRWCTRHRKIRPNVFDVLCFEFSMYCIFRDRRMRPSELDFLQQF